MYFFQTKAPHTNSSSVHSIFFSSDIPYTLTEDDRGNIPLGSHFNWSFDPTSILSTEQQKHTYFLSQIADMFIGKPNERLDEFLTTHTWLKEHENSLRHLISSAIYDGYIDHQSMMALPSESIEHGEFVKKWLKELYEFCMDPNVHIFIHHDNGDFDDFINENLKDQKENIHPNHFYQKLISFKNLSFDLDKRCSKAYSTETYNGKTVFKFLNSPRIRRTVNNLGTGYSTMCFDVEAGLTLDKYYKAEHPETIDLKVTDYCNYGCPFCYMGSGESGEPAKFENIKSIFKSLNASVFEVAIGGGEPTLYEDGNKTIVDICIEALKNNILPNVTTRNIDAVYDLWPVVNAFGISISNMEDADNFLNKIYGKKIRLPKKEIVRRIKNIPIVEICKWDRQPYINAHIIVGKDPVDDTIHLIRHILSTSFEKSKEVKSNTQTICLQGILLLGYKPVGRGKDFENCKDFNYKEFFIKLKHLIRELLGDEENNTLFPLRFSISVDTTLKDHLMKSGITSQELKFSFSKSKIFDDTYDENWHHIQYMREGKLSMYVDAVKMKYGASSWMEDSEMFDIEKDLTFEKFKNF